MTDEFELIENVMNKMMRNFFEEAAFHRVELEPRPEPIAHYILADNPETKCPSCEKLVENWGVVRAWEPGTNRLHLRMLMPCGHIFDLPTLKREWVDKKVERVG